MEKSIILTNDISEISKLNEFVEEIGNELSLAHDETSLCLPMSAK